MARKKAGGYCLNTVIDRQRMAICRNVRLGDVSLDENNNIVLVTRGKRSTDRLVLDNEIVREILNVALPMRSYKSWVTPPPEQTDWRKTWSKRRRRDGTVTAR